MSRRSNAQSQLFGLALAELCDEHELNAVDAGDICLGFALSCLLSPVIGTPNFSETVTTVKKLQDYYLNRITEAHAAVLLGGDKPWEKD